MSGEPQRRSPAMNSAASRRVRYAAQSAVLFVAVTACAAFAMVIAGRFPARFDVTATREHQLSDRTRRVLADLKGPHEVIVAVNAASVDPRAAQRTQDVLGALERASPALKVTLLDAASPQGAAELDRTLDRVVDRDQPVIERSLRALEQAIADARDLERRLNDLSGALAGLSGTVGTDEASARTLRRFFDESAAFARLSAQELAKASERGAAASRSMIGRTRVPALDQGASDLRTAFPNLIAQLATIHGSLRDLAGSTAAAVPEELRARSRQVMEQVSLLRDASARVQASLDDLPRLACASVARTLERSSAAIVIGPPGSGPSRSGVAAIDVAALFPARLVADAPAPDTRARTEELLASALNVLGSKAIPIVVLVHGEAERIAPDFGPLGRWAERLRSRGIEVVEWAAALDAEPPSLSGLNAGGTRPVVFATISTGTGSREGASRMIKLAAAIRSLVETGRNVLLSVNVSELPTTGQTDPMVDFLRPLGIDVDSARPLLHATQQPTGRLVGSDTILADPRAEHPIAGSIRGLTLRIPWAVPVRVRAAPAGVSIAPLIVVNAGGGAWAESEWMAFRRIPIEQRSSIANPPAPDSSRDDAAGPWTIACALEGGKSDELRAPAGRQRLVVVGGNGWFLDEIAHAETMLYARPVLYNPGNLELFDASIAWLAGQDDAIATGSQVRMEALIPPMSDAAIGAIRWGLIGGLPIGILLLGAGLRLLRG